MWKHPIGPSQRHQSIEGAVQPGVEPAGPSARGLTPWRWTDTVKPGVELIDDAPGLGAPVEKKVFYDFRLRMWLSRGDPIRWSKPWGVYDRGRIEDEGTTLFTSLRVDREYMFAGLFYGVEGMRVGGTRRIR